MAETLGAGNDGLSETRAAARARRRPAEVDLGVPIAQGLVFEGGFTLEAAEARRAASARASPSFAP